MKCSTCRKRIPPLGRKTCAWCRDRVRKYHETHKTEINPFKRHMVKIGAWKEKAR